MSEMASASQKVCPKCGGMVDADARFCKHCAFDLTNSAQSADAAIVSTKGQPNRSSKPLFLIGGVVVIGLLMLVILGAYIFTRNRTQSATATASPTPVPAPTMGDKAKQVEAKILRGETLSDSDIAGLSAYELRVLRNVHFARYGRKYDSPGLGDYFSTRSWYKPSDDYKESMVTSTDKANINLILAAERTAGATESANTNTNSTAIVMQPTPAPTLQRTNELNRDTILALVHDKFNVEVTASMSTSSFTMSNQTDVYTQMIKAKVLTCQNREGHWQFCRGGVNGSGLYVSQQEAGTTTAGGLSMVIGYKVPSAVTGISRLDQATAYADVLFTFEPNSSYDLYTKWSGVFYSSKGTQSEQHRALLRLYDDGWRVERFD